MTIREPITTPPAERSYGSVTTCEANDIEAGLDVTENAPIPPLATDENDEGNALLEYCDEAQLASLPYELRTSRCELLVMSTFVACLVLVCICCLLFIKSDHDDTFDKIFVGFICFVFFLLGLLCSMGLVESSRLLIRVDDQGITHRRLFRKHFMAWGNMKIIMIQLDKNTTRMRISILNRGEDDCLHFEHLANKLRMVFLLIVARKRDIVYCKQS